MLCIYSKDVANRVDVLVKMKFVFVFGPRFEKKRYHLKAPCSATSITTSSRWPSCRHAAPFPIMSFMGICIAASKVIGFGATS